MRKLANALAIIIAALLLITFLGCSAPDASAPSVEHESQPVAEFTIWRGARLVLVPVTFSGKTVLFCVDTGATRTAFDICFRHELGQSTGVDPLMTPAGMQQIETFRCPEAHVGSLKLSELPCVIGCDLANIRAVSGKEIYGIVGMDFLRKYAVEIDFDGGNLRLWESAPRGWKNRFEPTLIAFGEDGAPYISAVAGEATHEHFLIDTGANASTLAEKVFNDSRARRELTATTDSGGVVLGGQFRRTTGYLHRLRIGSYSHNLLRMDCSHFSALGIRYLSRFVVHLDFPNSIAYLEKGARFDVPDPTSTSGLSIVQVSGEKVVNSIDADGPAAVQGVRAGDLIVSAGGRDARHCDMVDLWEILTQDAGTRIPLELQRNGDRFSAVITTESRLIKR